jgi:Peptidase family M28/PA domain
MTRHVLLALALGAATTAQSVDLSRFRVSPERWLGHVRTLSADELGGRGNGTAGLRQAASYISSEFKKAGLEAGGDRGSYLQPFDVAARLEPDGGSALVLSSPSGVRSLRIGSQYYPLTSPPAGRLQAETPKRLTERLVFAGYGIAAPGLGYDDYAGLDVDGSAVIVFTHEPQEHDERSVFEGRALTPHSDIAHKAELARQRGATLLIVVEDPTHVSDRAMTQAWLADPQIGDYTIPVVRVERSSLQQALPALRLDALADEIDRTLMPRSRLVTNATISYVAPLVALSPRVDNVIGVLEGSDPRLAGEAVVIGAHYDHLGLGGRFSRDDETGQIHNGADDNASGTAMVIEMAHVARRHRAQFRRSIVFAAFAGEELGLLGSRHYVQHPPISMARTVAMLNLDMVGRARGRVLIGGADKHARFKQLIEELRTSSRLRLDDFREGYAEGASDNDSFEREQVPTLVFFTGFHGDYHRPTDDWPQTDSAGAAEIARLALAIASALAR